MKSQFPTACGIPLDTETESPIRYTFLAFFALLAFFLDKYVSFSLIVFRLRIGYYKRNLSIQFHHREFANFPHRGVIPLDPA